MFIIFIGLGLHGVTREVKMQKGGKFLFFIFSIQYTEKARKHEKEQLQVFPDKSIFDYKIKF